MLSTGRIISGPSSSQKGKRHIALMDGSRVVISSTVDPEEEKNIVDLFSRTILYDDGTMEILPDTEGSKIIIRAINGEIVSLTKGRAFSYDGEETDTFVETFPNGESKVYLDLIPSWIEP